MVTSADVARLAGVSLSTVSYALSGKRPVSQETRERIEKAIAELGFAPNAGARALASSQTNVLGLFVQFLPDEFSPAMLQYVLPITEAARSAGYDTLFVTEADGSHALQRIASSNMVDGVVLLNVAHDDPRLPVLRGIRQPGAMVGLPRSPEGFDVFDLDFEESARMLVDHLAELGHREVILVTPNEHVYERGYAYAWRFRDAALERASRHGIRVFSYPGQTQQPGLNEQLNRILDERPEATALLVHNDAAVAALPAVLHARGLRVPDDISVVGIYSEDFGRLFSLPYTAVESSPDKLGRSAVQTLVNRLRTPEAEGHVLELVAPEITDRGSTRAV